MEILKKLDIQDKIKSNKVLDYHEVPIYPWISKTLGIKWKEEYIRVNSAAIKCGDKMDIKEYIREYIWWCYPKIYNSIRE